MPDLIEAIMKQRGLNTRSQVYREVRRDDNPEHPRLSAWIYRRYQTNPPQVFVRNPYYWAVDPEGNQLPYIDRITIDVDTPDLFALKAAAGSYPAVFETENLRLSNYGLYMASAKQGDFEVRHFYSGQRSLWTIIFNLNLYHEEGDPVATQKWELLNRQRVPSRPVAGHQSRSHHQGRISTGWANRPRPIRDRIHRFTASVSTTPRLNYDPAGPTSSWMRSGLTRRDADGYRTLPDGSPMVWFIPYRANTLPGPFQFVIDDWAASASAPSPARFRPA